MREYITNLIWQFKETDKGEWAFHNCREIRLYHDVDATEFSCHVLLLGWMDSEAATEFYLKWL